MDKSASNLKIGGEIPSLTKTARMPVDQNARNVIHTDEYARDFGMRGALIGGSTLLSYVLEMLYGYFGQNWLRHGRINVAFIGGGAINGDIVTARGVVKTLEKETNGTRLSLDVYLENQKGQKIVIGEASCIVT
jgi:acyl dehydratase